MPPKANSVVPLTLKLKWNSICVMLLVKANSNVQDIREQLATALTSSQVLQASTGSDAMDEDDIDIPVPTHGEVSDDEADKKPKEEGESGSEPVTVDADSVRIGLPNQKSMTSFRDITAEEGTIDSLGVKEHMVLAFVVGDEEFAVDTATFDSQE